jgi:hypothetical protein
MNYITRIKQKRNRITIDASSMNQTDSLMGSMMSNNNFIMRNTTLTPFYQ